MKAKRQPKDYPTFSFRVTESDKIWLQTEVQALASRRNKNKEPGEPLERGNDIALEALRIGLAHLRKETRG